ncbi:hypothetical protein EON65_14765 [archaeon]|nr:MAG: hypothetical protein EON65_14765 [archaeon]
MSDHESSQDETIERKPRTKPTKKLQSQPARSSDQHAQKQVGNNADARRVENVAPIERVDESIDSNAWHGSSVQPKRKRNISDERRQQLREQMHAIRELRNNKADERRQQLEEMAKAKEEVLKQKMEKEATKLAKQRLQERKKQAPVVIAPKRKQKVIPVFSSSEESEEEDEEESESSEEEEIIIRKKKRKTEHKTIPPPPALKRHVQIPTYPMRPPINLY